MSTQTSELSRTPLQTVAAIYEAFGRGDVPTLLGHLAEDVTFEATEPPTDAAAAGHPLLAVRRGKDEVLDFFGALATCEVHAFEVVDLMSSDTQVAAHVRLEMTTPAGVRLVDDEMHRWQIGPDGRVVAMKHYADTAKHLAAWYPVTS